MPAIAPETCAPDRKTSGVIQVIAWSPDSLQNGLDRAVQEVRQAALPDASSGILITRQSASLFTVEPSEKVPYGTTIERDWWNRQSATAATSVENVEAL